jgi:phenylacetaldehyde dehydrogenase
MPAAAPTLLQPTAAAAAYLASPHRLFIGGEFCEAKSDATFEIENPSRQETIAVVQSAGPEDIALAVKAARLAFETSWGKWGGAARQKVLLRFADLVEANADLIGEIESLEAGLPISLSKATVGGFCVEFIRYYAGWATKIEGASIPALANGREDQQLMVYTVREPVGVVACIVPWNAPASMVVLKIAPALAAGCTVVLKTAEMAPLAAEFLAKLWAEAGGPAGSFNLIHGFGRDVGAALVTSPGVDKVSFTGSTAVGKEIVRAVSDDLRKVTLELGGKSPFVVFADAPLEEAIPAAALACFFLGGQNCMAGTRLFLHESIRDEFMEGLAKFSEILTVGDALSPDTMIGPLISGPHKTKVEGFVTKAQEEGGVVAFAGRIPQGVGHFVAPTIIDKVTPDMTLAREEVFGPVLGVQTFGDDEDALAGAISQTTYGLSGSIWTQDLRRAHRFVRRIDSGQVGVNIHAAISPETPFGGNRQSGWGREFGKEGLDGFLKTKAVSISLGPNTAVSAASQQK